MFPGFFLFGEEYFKSIQSQVTRFLTTNIFFLGRELYEVVDNLHNFINLLLKQQNRLTCKRTM